MRLLACVIGPSGPQAHDAVAGDFLWRCGAEPDAVASARPKGTFSTEVMMRLSRILLTAALLAVSTTTATAGPIRDRLAARFNRPSGCSSCTVQPPQAVQYGGAGLYPQPQPVPAQVVMPQVAGGEQYQYQPIRLTSPVPTCPTCVGGVCR